MKQFTTLLSLCLIIGFSHSQSTQLDLRYNLHFPSDIHVSSGDTTGGSDCFGWTSPGGVDYAIFGTFYGTHYVRASDGAVLDSVPGALLNDYYYHRDIKTYRNYAYIVGEMNGAHAGVQVVDLSFLPDSVHLVTEYTFGTWPGAPRSHNLSIDTAKAFAYVLAPDYTGCRIISLANPTVLSDVGFITTGSIHDIYARNDTVWVAEGYNTTYSIWNTANKANPIKIGEITDPNFGYCHQIWPTDDGRHFVTCEETAGKTVKIWNMTNINNITLAGEYSAPCSLAHNAHVMGDSMYISNYQSGVRVVDISNRSNPVEVGYYDTYPAGDAGTFYGCWGAFPFSKNGYIYGSNIEGWMQILKFPVAASVQQEKEIVKASAWPNPSTGKVKFEFPSIASINSVEVNDINGKRISVITNTSSNGKTISGEWAGTSANGSKAAAGVYFLKYGENSLRVVME